MKNQTLRKILLSVAFVVALVSMFIIATSAESYTGTCGAVGNVENVEWSLDLSTGVLNVTGTGAMADYVQTAEETYYPTSPWGVYYNYVKSITVGEGITHIGNHSFAWHQKATSLSLPSTLESIGQYAFLWDNSLETLVIPKSVKSMGVAAFGRAGQSLLSIKVEEGNTAFSDAGNCLIDIASKTLLLGCRNSVIPDDGSVEIIAGAFSRVDKLKEIVIPESVKRLRAWGAFAYCYDLVSVTINGNLDFVGNESFIGLPETTTITFNQKYELPTWRETWDYGCNATIVWGDVDPEGYHYCETAAAVVTNTYIMKDGTFCYGCADCDYVEVTYKAAGDALLDLDFEYDVAAGETVADHLPEGVTLRASNTASYVTKGDRNVLQVGEFWLDDSTNYTFFKPDVTMLNFEVMFEENDITSLERESLITYVLGKQNVTPQADIAWQFVLGYGKNADGKQYIFSGNSATETNSVEIENGKWYNCTVVSNTDNYYAYVDGKLLAVKTKADYTDEKYDGGAYLRFANKKNSLPNIDNVTMYSLEKFEPTVTIESTKASSGEEFEVNIFAKDLDSVKSMLIDDIVYDTEIFTLVDAKWNITGAEIADWDEEDQIATLTFDKNTALEGAIFTLIFKTVEDINATYPISCSVAINERVGYDDLPVEFTLVDSSIKIIGYVRGDMDHDGDLESNDAIYLLRHVLMPTKYPLDQNGDLNGDGAVNTNDAIYLLRHTFDSANYPLGCEGEHVLATTRTYTAVKGGFTTPCTVCGVSVLLKTQDPSFLLTFDEDVATEAAKYDIGLSIYDNPNASDWTTTEDADGNKSLYSNGTSGVSYINIDDPSKLADLGTFVISFDYMSTANPAGINDKGALVAPSIVSILNNYYGGKGDLNGNNTGWGWMLKINEEKDVFTTVNTTAKLNDSNSCAIERNVKYKIQLVVEPNAKVAHVYIDGNYIGNAGQHEKISSLKDANASIRFGDGPVCGHTIDNFAISALK